MQALVRVWGREMLICWAKGSFFTRLKLLQGKHQRVSKSESVVVRLPRFRYVFKLFQVLLFPCNPNRLFPTLLLIFCSVFMSLTKSELPPLTNYFFSQQAFPYPISSKQLTKAPLILMALSQDRFGSLLVNLRCSASGQFRVCFTLLFPGCITIPKKQQSTKLRTPDLAQTTCWAWGFLGGSKRETLLWLCWNLSCSLRTFQICGVTEISEL